MMTLRNRTIALIFILITCVFFITYFATQRFVLDGFRKLQTNDMNTTVKRVLTDLDNQLNALAGAELNYSAWDETWQFVHDVEPGTDVDDTTYIQQNYPDMTFTGNGFDVMVLLNTRGEVVFERAYDEHHGNLVTVPVDVLNMMTAEHSVLNSLSLPGQERTGIIATHEGPLLVVSEPIIHSNNQGPVGGVMLVGRWMNQTAVAEIEHQSSVAVQFQAIPALQASAYARAGTSAPFARATGVQENQGNTVLETVVLRDVLGHPAYQLVMQKEQSIYEQGVHSVFVFLITLMLVTLGCVLIFGVYLDRRVLLRLKKFRERLAGIQLHKDLSVRVVVDGNDEIGAIQRNFNGLMNTLDASQKLAEYHAYHDALTGAVNRYRFYDVLTKAMDRAASDGQMLGIVFVDMDQFKHVNDRLGHERGDQLLRAATDRLRSCIGTNDVISRFGGDEFVVLLQDVRDAEHIEAIAEDMCECLNVPFQLGEHAASISASIGVSVFPTDGVDGQTLIRNADIAMLSVKRQGKNHYRMVTSELRERLTRDLLLERDIAEAVANHEMYLVYQPKFRVGSWDIVGVETLLRWRHPVCGEISPVEFIPIAESTRAILGIGEWVLHEALATLKAWRSMGFEQLTVAVNMSGVQMSADGSVDRILSALTAVGMEPGCLELEITESVAMDHVNQALQTLTALKQRGIRISIDDFGTGYSSLSYLRKFPIHVLKIDRSFIQNLGSNQEDEAVVRSIIDLAHVLGMQVVAEGVETAEQVVLLETFQCDVLQGYHLSHPLLPADVTALLKKQAKVVDVEQA